MYKLFKTFNAKAKQLAKEKGKGGGAKDGTDGEYAPVKITTTIQEQVKQFKVQCTHNSSHELFPYTRAIFRLPLCVCPSTPLR